MPDDVVSSSKTSSRIPTFTTDKSIDSYTVPVISSREDICPDHPRRAASLIASATKLGAFRERRRSLNCQSSCFVNRWSVSEIKIGLEKALMTSCLETTEQPFVLRDKDAVWPANLGTESLRRASDLSISSSAAQS